MPQRIPHHLAALVLVLSVSLASMARTQADTFGSPVYAGTPTDLIEAVNALRASYGLQPYRINSILMAAAQGHADYMAATGRVSHTGMSGSTITQRLLSLGYPLAGDLTLGGFRSENITSGSEGMPAQEAVDRWMGDSLHLNTMISPDLTEIGAGVTVNQGRVYYVIDCARPTDSGIPQTVNTTGPGAFVVPTLPAGVSGIIIPVEVVTPNAEGDWIHEVKAGQTLWQIAISYDTKIDEIKRLNNLFDNEIYPGMKLLVKQGEFLTATISHETLAPAMTPSLAISPVSTGTKALPTTFSLPGDTPQPMSTEDTLQVAMGIIALAVLGGGVVAWWGSRKK